MIADILSRPCREIIDSSQTLYLVHNELEFLAAGVFSSNLNVDCLGLQAEELSHGQLRDPEIRIVIDLLKEPDVSKDHRAQKRSSIYDKPAESQVDTDPHSWCEPGNQKDWPIRGEHSVYRIFNFDDMDIEKKNMIFDKVSSWFVPIIQELVLIDDVLYRIEYAPKSHSRLNQKAAAEPSIQIVLPRAMIPGILKLFHDHLLLGSHASYERTLWKLRQFCIFENMASIIKEFVANCDLCNRANCKKIKPPLGENLTPSMPFLAWGIDAAGPFPITSAGNRYVLLGVDLFSGLVVLHSVPSLNTEFTMKFLWERIFAYYGLPEAVLSDHGSNFDSTEIRKMFKELNCKKIYSSPYNPQSNGAVEHKVKILKKILSHTCANLYQVEWDQKLPLIMLSMNASLNSVRKFSSFIIAHGFNGRTLADLAIGKPTTVNYFDGYESYVTRLVQNISEIHQVCANEIKVQRAKQAHHYNKTSKEVTIEVGDIVYCRDITSVGRKTTNYSFRGPYVVLAKLYGNVFYLGSLNPSEGRKRTANARHLKKLDHEPFLKYNPKYAEPYDKLITNSEKRMENSKSECNDCTPDAGEKAPYNLRTKRINPLLMLENVVPGSAPDSGTEQETPYSPSDQSSQLEDCASENNAMQISAMQQEPLINTEIQSSIQNRDSDPVVVEQQNVTKGREGNPFYSLRKLK